MTLVYMDKLPEKKTRKGKTLRRSAYDVQKMIDKFADSGKKAALIKCKDGEYASWEVLYSTVRGALRQSKRLVYACRRGNDIYLVRKDV